MIPPYITIITKVKKIYIFRFGVLRYPGGVLGQDWTALDQVQNQEHLQREHGKGHHGQDGMNNKQLGCKEEESDITR